MGGLYKIEADKSILQQNILTSELSQGRNVNTINNKCTRMTVKQVV